MSTCVGDSGVGAMGLLSEVFSGASGTDRKPYLGYYGDGRWLWCYAEYFGIVGSADEGLLEIYNLIAEKHGQRIARLYVLDLVKAFDVIASEGD